MRDQRVPHWRTNDDDGRKAPTERTFEQFIINVYHGRKVGGHEFQDDDTMHDSDGKWQETRSSCSPSSGRKMHARVSKIVFGAYDLKTGACGSCINLNEEKFFNHKISITGGVLENESSELLKLFFKTRRDNQN